jgi:CBS domain-containing protein
VSTSTTNRTVQDILLPPSEIPAMPAKTLMKEALEMMTAKRLGLACVTDEAGKLVAIFTDGDLRRLLLRSQKPLSALFADDIIDHARTEFTTVGPDLALQDALDMLQEREIFDLPVVDGDGQLLGVIHLHPALNALLHS